MEAYLIRSGFNPALFENIGYNAYFDFEIDKIVIEIWRNRKLYKKEITLETFMSYLPKVDSAVGPIFQVIGLPVVIYLEQPYKPTKLAALLTNGTEEFDLLRKLKEHGISA